MAASLADPVAGPVAAGAHWLTVSSPQIREARLWKASYLVHGPTGTVVHVTTSTSDTATRLAGGAPVNRLP